MPYKNQLVKRDYLREYMRNYRASKQGLTVKPVKPNSLNPVNPAIVNPVVKPCPSCPDLKKQLENLQVQIQNLASENQNLLSEQKTIQSKLTELENSQLKSKKKEPKKTPKKVVNNQSLKVDLAELEKETGLKKD